MIQKFKILVFLYHGHNDYFTSKLIKLITFELLVFIQTESKSIFIISI